jgi:hypothetical protein
MQQPGNAARDDEPVSGAGGSEDAGSVVFTVDRSADGGVYARAAADVGALFGLGRPYEPLPIPPPGSGDAMRWSPPSEGEDTPPCPA